MLTIHQADPSAIAVAMNVVIDMPAVAYVGIDEGELVGTGGLAWGKGRCWAWLSLPAPKRDAAYTRAIVRMAKLLWRKAAQLGEVEVYTVRDVKYETSERLLTFLGFVRQEDEDGLEVWCKRLR